MNPVLVGGGIMEDGGIRGGATLTGPVTKVACLAVSRGHCIGTVATSFGTGRCKLSTISEKIESTRKNRMRAQGPGRQVPTSGLSCLVRRRAVRSHTTAAGANHAALVSNEHVARCDEGKEGANMAGNETVQGILWTLLKPELPLLAAAVVTLTVGVIVTLMFPLALGELFDVVRQHVASSVEQLSPQKGVFEIGLFGYMAMVKEAWRTAPRDFYPVLMRLSGCLVFSAITNAGTAYLAPILGERFGCRLRKMTMKSLLSKNQKYFDDHTRGELMSRLNADCTAVQTTLVDFLGQRGLRSVLEISFSLAVITTKNPLLAIIALVVTPALTLALRGIVKKSSVLTVERQKNGADTLRFASERLAWAQTVQLFGQEEAESMTYDDFVEQEYQTAKRVAKFQGVVEGAGRLAVNMGALSILAFGGALVIQGHMAVGTLLAFQVYNFFLSIGLSSLSASLGDFGKVTGSLARLQSILGGTHAQLASARTRHDFVKPLLPELPAVDIKFENVWFKYSKSEDWILKDVNFEVAAGETLALVGQSGSGKTTIASLLLGLYTPQRGNIYVGGKLLCEETIPEIRSLCATMFQNAGLMSGPISDQIRFGLENLSDAKIAEAMTLAHCDEFVSDLSMDVGERGSNLSGGQQQRVALARALLRQPKLLVLDEPTAALDIDSERVIELALQSLACTRVIIAHRLSTVRKADKILVLEHGRILEEGSHMKLMAISRGAYRDMVLQSTIEAKDIGHVTI